MASPTSSTDELRDHRLHLAVAFAATLALFLPTLVSYHGLWVEQPNTHGYLIAGGTLWLVWRERDVFGAVRGWKDPLLAICAISIVWCLSRITTVQFAAQGAVPVVALGWAATVFGPAALRRLAPATAVFLIAVPFWGFLNEPLRRLTVKVSYALLGLLQIPVTINGSVIGIQNGYFTIADACAGFNYFMSGLAVGGLYAVGFTTRWRTRATVLVLAAGLSLVANWIRVTSLVVIGHVSRMEAAIIYDHGRFGWLIFFAFVLVVFFPLARLLEKRLDRREAAERADTPVEEATRPEVREPSGWSGMPLTPAILATLTAAVGPVAYLAIGALPSREPAEAQLADDENAWVLASTGSDRAFEWSPQFAGADVRRTELWATGEREITVDRLAYRRQGQGAELIGFGNAIAPDSMLVAHRLFGPVGEERRYVNEAVVREGDGFVLVWYWYRVGGVETASTVKAKLLEIPAFFRRIASSELVAVSAACEADSCAAASSTLLGFFGGGT